MRPIFGTQRPCVIRIMCCEKTHASGEIRPGLSCIGQRSRQLRNEQLKFHDLDRLGPALRTRRTAPRIDTTRPPLGQPVPLFRLGSNHNKFVGPIRSRMLVLECMPPVIPFIVVQQTVMTNVSIMLPLTTARASPPAIASHPLDTPRRAESIPSCRHHSHSRLHNTAYGPTWIFLDEPRASHRPGVEPDPDAVVTADCIFPNSIEG